MARTVLCWSAEMSEVNSKMITAITRKALLGAALLSVLFMSGCLEGHAVRTGAYLPPKPHYAPIDVYLDSDPGVAFAEVGHISAKGANHNAYMDDVIAVLQDQARSLGADAVIVTDTWFEEEITYDEYGYPHTRERLYATGIAITYL